VVHIPDNITAVAGIAAEVMRFRGVSALEFPGTVFAASGDTAVHILWRIAARGHGCLGQEVQITETYVPHAKAPHLTLVFAQLEDKRRGKSSGSRMDARSRGGGVGGSLENSLTLRVTVWPRLLAPVPSRCPLTIHCSMDDPHFLCTRTGMVRIWGVFGCAVAAAAE
jgi:hypothetical protein